MMRPYFVFLLISLSSTLIAQRWRDCKVITTNSDTIIGKAILKSDTLLMKTIDGKTVRYSPSMVLRVVIDSDVYKNSNQMNLSDNGNAFFVEVLMDGDLQLYFKNQENPSFFIKTENSKMTELTRTFKDVQKDGLNYKLTYDAYKNQIKDVFKDCPTFKLNQSQNYFSQPKMIGLVKKYSLCQNQEITFEKKFKKSSWISLVGGVGITNINFTLSNAIGVANTFPYFNNTSGSSTTPFFGIQFETSATSNQSSRFFTEALLKKTSITVSDAYFDVSYLKVNLGLKKIIANISKSEIDIHGGFCFNPILNVNSNKSPSFKTTEFGAFLGVGYTYAKIGFFIRDEITNGFINTSTIFSKPNTIYFGAKIIVL